MINKDIFAQTIICFIISLILFYGNSYGQVSYEERLADLPNPQLKYGLEYNGRFSKAADIDNDGDIDLIGIGRYNYQFVISKHVNDGLGNFASEAIATTRTTYTTYKFEIADIDLDGDIDFIVATYHPNGGICKFYINDGNGNFILDNFQIPLGILGNIKFVDKENDGDPDIFVGGKDKSGVLSSVFYENDGNGNFSLINETGIIPVDFHEAFFSDLNGDSFPDLILVTTISPYYTIFYYLNDKQGNFIEVTNNPFLPVGELDVIEFIDIENDGDTDVLVNNSIYNTGVLPRLFINDGNGNFIFRDDNTFKYSSGGRTATIDLENDGDMDIIITGSRIFVDNSFLSHVDIYNNDGIGNFTKVNSDYLVGVNSTFILTEDFDGDNNEDLIYSGYFSREKNDYLEKSEYFGYYLNDGFGYFKEVVSSPIISLGNGYSGFSDVDNDGDIDLLVAGYNDHGFRTTKLYKNDGLGNFKEALSGIVGLSLASFDFADVDNDGDEDVLIVGYFERSNYVALLYSNNGNGYFTLRNESYFEGVINGVVLFEDIDNDGWVDVLIKGTKFSSIYDGSFKIYKNLGNFRFRELSTGLFMGDAPLGQAAFSDVDNDGDKDLIVLQKYYFKDNTFVLYLNQGNGNFIESPNQPFNIKSNDFKLSDVDNDGDEDVILIRDNIYPCEIYKNDGKGNFILTDNSQIPYGPSTYLIFDADVDGDEDILVTNDIYSIYSSLYLNDGMGSYQQSPQNPFPLAVGGFRRGRNSIAADINNDGKMDVFMTDVYNRSISKLFINTFVCTDQWYADVDNDGYGDPQSYVFECFTPDGFVENSLDCDDSNPNILSQELIPIPEISLNSTNNNEYSIKTTEFSGYQWYKDGVILHGQNSQFLTVTETGNYSVVVNTENCILNESELFYIEINENCFKNGIINIYPNPSINTINIEWNRDYFELIKELKIINMLGQTINTFKFDSFECPLTLDISHLSNGAYLLFVMGNNNTVSQKFVRIK